MNREGARLIPVPSRILEQVSMKCPRCDDTGTFSYIQGIVLPREEGDIEYSLWACPSIVCRGVVHVISDQHDQILDYYPKRVPKIDPSVPSRVESDMAEAYKAFNVGAWRASASMSRRALQSSLIDKKTTKEKLLEQINELYETQALTKDIRNWAHEIRLTGNVGAHPDKDGLEDVSPADAKELLDFMEQYLNYVYVMPAKVAERRAAKDQPKQSTHRDIREKNTIPTKSF